MVAGLALALLLAAPTPPSPPAPPRPQGTDVVADDLERQQAAAAEVVEQARSVGQAKARVEAQRTIVKAMARQVAPGPEARLLGDWPSAPSGKKVTITDKVDVDEALQKISEAAGWDLVANTGRVGDRTLVVTLKDVPVEAALEAVLEGTSLAATRRGNAVTVAPQTLPVLESQLMTGFSPPSGKKVTLDFSDTPAGEALQKISEAAGWSIVLPPGLRGAVTARFRGIPAEEAMKAVLSQTQLSASRDGSVVTIARSSGPSVVIRGGKKQFVFGGGQGILLPGDEDVQAAAEDAKQAAEDAKQAARDAVAGLRRGSGHRGKDKVVGGDITVGPGERWRDVVAIRGNVHMGPGSSARQVTAVLGSIELEPGATVDQEVVAVGGSVRLAPGSHVGSDAVVVGGEVVMEPGATVDGQQVAVSVPGITELLGLVGSKASSVSHVISPWHKLGHALAKFLVFFALGLLVLVFTPARLDGVAVAIGRQPLKVLLAGLLGTLAMPVLTVLLAVTIVGIPLIAVQVIAILLAAVVGYTALSLYIGRALPLHPQKAASALQLAVGTAVVVAVSENPGGRLARHGLGLAHRLRCRRAHPVRAVPGERAHADDARFAPAAGGLSHRDGGDYRLPGPCEGNRARASTETRRTSA